jgi:two-component system, chemotaxis family, chemotaxis protein CheY
MKILLIDDSTLSRNILKRSLAGNHEFFEAENGMRGIELFYVEKPDLVFLDLTMPDSNGLEILEQLKQMDAQARVIIGTADIQEFTRQQANELGASAYLNKPFTPDVVQEVVNKVMGSAQW